MIEDFNSLTDCLDLAGRVRNDHMNEEQVRQKNVKLQQQVAHLRKKVSSQKILIEKLGGTNNVQFMGEYAEYLKIVGKDKDLAKFVVSAVAKGLVKPEGIQYEFSMLQFKFYQIKSFCGVAVHNFYTDGIIKFFNHMFNICGATDIH